MLLNNQKNDRIFGLDFLRAFAVILVVLSHLHYLLDFYNPTIMILSGLLGFAGVELFFVISGFLIGRILLNLITSESFNKATLLKFLKRRWFRTLPNYFVVLILNIFLALVLKYNLINVWKYFFFLQNFNKYSITFFTESWSLSIEEWTYILVPISLFLALKIFKFSKKYIYLITVFVLIVFCHLIRFFCLNQNEIIDINLWNLNVKSIVLYRLDSILFGFIIAWFYCFYYKFIKEYAVYLIIISLLLFLFQFFIFNFLGITIKSSPIYFNVFYFTLSSLTFSFSLPFFTLLKSSNTKIESSIQFISRISYSIYLLHYSLISVLTKYLIESFALGTITSIGLYLILVLFSSYLLFSLVEKPFMAIGKKY